MARVSARAVREWANCREATVDGDDIWIADPMTGHWLSAQEQERLGAWLKAQAPRHEPGIRPDVRQVVVPAEPPPIIGHDRAAEEGGDLSRDQTIKRIRAALRKRSGKAWSVTGGRGTAYGWIRIHVPPARRTWHHVQRPGTAGSPGDFDVVDTGVRGGFAGPADRAELAALLGLESIHPQGVSIPASSDYYREYVDRAEGRTPSVVGRPYWD